MSARVIRLPAPASYAALHAMALERWREAVKLKHAGDEDGYRTGLEDARLLDEQACLARTREERRITQHRQIYAALNGLLELAERHGSSGDGAA